jgi:mRNA interferase HigB
LYFAKREVANIIKTVHVISKSSWKDAVAADPKLAARLAEWHKVAQAADWKSLVDVRKAYPHADYAEPYTVFNIQGGAYRLIVKIEYRWQLIFVKGLYTHAEYDRGRWKE